MGTTGFSQSSSPARNPADERAGQRSGDPAVPGGLVPAPSVDHWFELACGPAGERRLLNGKAPVDEVIEGTFGFLACRGRGNGRTGLLAHGLSFPAATAERSLQAPEWRFTRSPDLRPAGRKVAPAVGLPGQEA